MDTSLSIQPSGTKLKRYWSILCAIKNYCLRNVLIKKGRNIVCRYVNILILLSCHLLSVPFLAIFDKKKWYVSQLHFSFIHHSSCLVKPLAFARGCTYNVQRGWKYETVLLFLWQHIPQFINSVTFSDRKFKLVSHKQDSDWVDWSFHKY